MGGAVVTNAGMAPHYAWGKGCDGWRLHDLPGLRVIEERMPPRACEARHFHEQAQQVFYVLDGVLTLELADSVHRLGAGDALPVLPTVPHQARNDGDADVRFLVISAPSTVGDRTAA